MHLLRELKYIIRRAQEGDGRVVRLGPLILFSTQTGDAWLLDTDDRLALCLARDCETRPYLVSENDRTFQIAWQASYEIVGDVFSVVSKDGRIRSIFGYPTAEITRLSEMPLA